MAARTTRQMEAPGAVVLPAPKLVLPVCAMGRPGANWPNSTNAPALFVRILPAAFRRSDGRARYATVRGNPWTTTPLAGPR